MIMALTEPVKKGGRYTKKQQEERRLEVHHLHFDEKKSAVEIAEVLDVNRNTVNEDIKFWYWKLGDKSEGIDLEGKMKQQIQRMEIQRDRILGYLDEVDTPQEKIIIEKSLVSIDKQLSQFLLKVISKITTFEPVIETEEIDEKEIKELVKDLLFPNDGSGYEKIYSEKFLTFEIIHRTKRDVDYAERMILKMKSDGLLLCKRPHHKKGIAYSEFDPSDEYDFEMFAFLRGYISPEGLDFIWELQEKIQKNKGKEKMTVETHDKVN